MPQRPRFHPPPRGRHRCRECRKKYRACPACGCEYCPCSHKQCPRCLERARDLAHWRPIQLAPLPAPDGTSYVRELELRYRTIRIIPDQDSPPVLDTTRAIVDYLTPALRDLPHELIIVVALTPRSRPIAQSTIARGTADAALVRPADVLRVALLTNATALIVGHNHPSGDETPSADDAALYRRLTMAAEIIGIRLLDFVIIGATHARSVQFSQTIALPPVTP